MHDHTRSLNLDALYSPRSCTTYRYLIMSSAVSDTTVSPAPFSPFSTYSSTSGVTSDGNFPHHLPQPLPSSKLLPLAFTGAPDLGEFTTVFRALGNFNRGRSNRDHFDDFDDATTPTSLALSPSDDDSEDNTTTFLSPLSTLKIMPRSLRCDPSEVVIQRVRSHG